MSERHDFLGLFLRACGHAKREGGERGEERESESDSERMRKRERAQERKSTHD